MSSSSGSFVEATLDDLMRAAIDAVWASGSEIAPTKGPARDLTGVRLELTNPLARLSRSEARGRIFSSLGELCWYLSGSNQVDQISYYISRYAEYDEDGLVHGGYGPRLRGDGPGDQIGYVIAQLGSSRDSRKAVVQLFDRSDVLKPHLDVPCTCTLQFVVRDGALHLVTYMRSNDVHLGLPHDVFSFTMIQELVARTLGLPLGTYVHMAGSLHLYETDIASAERFMDEGWQSTIAMPPMPEVDPWPSVDRLLDAEREFRKSVGPPERALLEPGYWKDLERILAIFALIKRDRREDIPSIVQAFTSDVFGVFVADKLP